MSSQAPHHIVGVDVGGTYTDIFVLDEASGAVRIAKVSSTNAQAGSDQSVGFLRGVAQGLGDVSFDQIATVIHGTTVGTNALLERKIAKTGLITTQGFRDVLEMRRRDRPQTWGLRGNFTPVIARDVRLEVDERVLADGSIHTAIDLAQVRAAAQVLLDSGCEAVCVFFINAYANAANEAAAVAAVRALWPNAYVTASHEILPEIREFERASTAALNAALQPVLGRYLDKLDRALRAAGSTGELLVVQSNGGVMSVDTAKRLPARTALSGPAAGVIACAHIARSAGFANVMTGDVGGTSFDVSLIAEGRIALAAQTQIEFGMVVRTPMIEITTIGAGGGSVARVDASGLLHMGPESAGSFPGPVCYGLRRPEDAALGPTLTDAHVVLGRINPARPIGNLRQLDVAAAKHAITQHVGAPLGLDVMAAAEAMLRVANAKMAGALRLVSIERGHDPKKFSYMPFGGGGALNVCAMLREVGIDTGLVPRYPGVTSALGCVIADVRHDAVQTVNQALDAIDIAALTARIEAKFGEVAQALEGGRLRFLRIEKTLEFDMLYIGQTHTIAVPLMLDGGDCDAVNLSRANIRAAFETVYEKTFGRILPGAALKVLNFRVAVIGVREKFDLARLAQATVATEARMSAPRETRSVWINGAAQPVPVYDRLRLPNSATIHGPALFEQSDTTVWLEPGFVAQVDALGNLLLRRVA